MADIGTPDTNPSAWSASPPRTRVTQGGSGALLGEKILAALNLNSKQVTRVVLDISPAIAMLTVERVVFTPSDLAAVEHVLERWVVTPEESAEPAAPRSSPIADL